MENDILVNRVVIDRIYPSGASSKMLLKLGDEFNDESIIIKMIPYKQGILITTSGGGEYFRYPVYAWDRVYIDDFKPGIIFPEGINILDNGFRIEIVKNKSDEFYTLNVISPDNTSNNFGYKLNVGEVSSIINIVKNIKTDTHGT